MTIPRVSKDPQQNWENNAIQFSRLIAELQFAGAFTPVMITTLADEMDLDNDQVYELVDRATDMWDAIKAKM